LSQLRLNNVWRRQVRILHWRMSYRRRLFCSARCGQGKSKQSCRRLRCSIAIPHCHSASRAVISHL